MNELPYRLSSRRAWQVLGSRYALTSPVFALLSVPAVASVVVLYMGYPLGPLWMWWLLTAVSWGVPVAVLLVFRWTALPARERSSKPMLTLVAFIVAGLVRGIALVPLTIALNVADVSTLVSRVLGGTILVTLVLGLGALTVGAMRDYRTASNKLYAVRAELEELRDTMNDRIRAQRMSLLDRSMRALAPTIDALRDVLQSNRSAQDAEGLARKFSDAVDTVVRPLSTSLAQEQTNIELTAVANKTRIYWGNLMQPIPLGRFILPGTFVVLMVLTTAGSLTTHVPMVQALTILGILSVSTFVVLWVARLIIRNHSIPYALGSPVYVGIHGLIGLIGVGLALAGVITVPRHLLVGFVIVLIAVALAIYFYLSVELLRDRALVAQQESIAELNVAVSSLRQQLNVNAKRIANVLHGPVQSVLFASALRLQQATEVDEALAGRILSDMESALTKLSETDLEQPNLDLFLDEMRQVWGDAASFDFIEAVPMRAELDGDSTATQCVVEVIREGVNNAIKHGKASEIIVEFDRPSEGLVQVCVVNNGHALKGLSSGGYGSSVLDDMTHDWTIREVNGKTVLTAQVALNPNQVSSDEPTKQGVTDAR